MELEHLEAIGTVLWFVTRKGRERANEPYA
jgi:hypothetical protein